MKSLRWPIFLFLITSLLFTYCSIDDAEDMTLEENDPIVEIDSLDTDIPETDSIDVSEDDLYFQEMEIEHLHFDSSNLINVIFIGENYSKQDLLREDGKYRNAALLHYDYLFSYPPFSQFKADFNYSIVYAAGDFEQSAFNYGQVPSSDVDYAKVEEYVSAATGTEGFSENNLILFGINKPVTGRGGNKIAFFWAEKPDMMLHEVGHAFGLLADEYSTGVRRPLFEIPETDWPNVDITNDSSLVKWRKYFGLPGYEDIGMFEGGYYSDTSVWRPTETSIMRETQPDPSKESFGFNAVCREVLVREIYRLKGDSLTFEEFLEIDSPNL